MEAKAYDIVRQLEEASPMLAASIWTKVAEDRALAMEVHKRLSPKGRVELAQKLADSQNTTF
tara:strand:- start:607 stop:792 length:186 start_codon:yes stop_codon:yes gene_type:complete